MRSFVSSSMREGFVTAVGIPKARLFEFLQTDDPIRVHAMGRQFMCFFV